MDLIVVDVEKRDESGSRAARRLRASGKTPAVLCGLDRPTVSLSLSSEVVADLAREGRHLVELSLGGEQQQALISEMQYDFLGDDVLHVDFTRVKRGQQISVTVPVELEGHAKGASEGGIVNHVLAEITVECTPSKIPEKIVVDIAHLGIGDSIQVGELQLGEGVTTSMPADAGVVTVSAPVAAEPTEAEEEAEEGAEAPEIIGEEAEEGEGEGEGEESGEAKD